MSGRTSASFPAAAYSWITPEPGPLLVVGTASVPVAKRIARSQVTVVDAATPALQKLAIRWPSARRVAADITRLPFRPQIFSAALVAQDLSGLSSEAFPAYARALKPGGQLLIQCTARDDTVPWVRRLAAILQQVNPEAMTDSANLAAVDAVAASSHFLDCAHRSFRMWVPITKDQLLKQVDQA
ncbi:MAG: class I SAM-dependent methyltransferase, partial [Propionibacteriaceae bacterium]|nr:class I SAM-dependent methyltransferase [Propionibacteriaceae bacterium]